MPDDLLARAAHAIVTLADRPHSERVVRDLAAALRAAQGEMEDLTKQRDDWLRMAIKHDGAMYEAGTRHAIEGYIRPECRCPEPGVPGPLCPIHPSAQQAAALRAVVEPSDEVVERVARALYERGGAVEWDVEHDWYREDFRLDARAALAAIRDGLAEHGVNVDA